MCLLLFLRAVGPGASGCVGCGASSCIARVTSSSRTAGIPRCLDQRLKVPPAPQTIQSLQMQPLPSWSTCTPLLEGELKAYALELTQHQLWDLLQANTSITTSYKLDPNQKQSGLHWEQTHKQTRERAVCGEERNAQRRVGCRRQLATNHIKTRKSTTGCCSGSA